MRLRAELRPDCSSLPEDVLGEVTADGHTFASLEWYRFLESIDLADVAGGQVRLDYAVVHADEQPVCVCPVLRARGQGIYFAYSIRRYYFEHWVEESLRHHPRLDRQFARLLRGVAWYRRALEWCGTPLDDCLLVGSPLCVRGQVPVAPSSPALRQDVYRCLLKCLKRESRRRRAPLWFFCVPGESSRLARELDTNGFDRSFLFYDNVVDVSGFRRFGDYLRSFRRPVRRAFLRELRSVERAGVAFTVANELSDCAEAVADICVRRGDPRRSNTLRQPVEFWRKLGDSFGSRAEAILAEGRRETLGFHVLLRSERRGELWAYRMGRSALGQSRSRSLASALAFHEPIRRAIGLGYRRVWLGPTAYEAKSFRGAKQIPLYSYFWFPRKWDRWVLMPYLSQFGHIVREQIARSMQHPRTFRVALQKATQPET